MTIKGLLVGIMLFMVVLLLSAIGALTWWSARDRAVDTPVSSAGLVIPTFTHQVIDFVPKYDPTLTLPFSTGAIIDIDGDGVEELFLVGGIEFGWGAVFEDFNLDGRDDLVVSENYVGFPLHKVPAWRLDGRFMLQTENGEFAEVGTEAGLRNRAYGISPLVADFNADGYPDLVHVNLLGPQNVFISEGGTQGYLKVSLPNTVDSIGVEISVRLDDERLLKQTFIVGEGLVSDQTHILTFGLG